MHQNGESISQGAATTSAEVPNMDREEEGHGVLSTKRPSVDNKKELPCTSESEQAADPQGKLKPALDALASSKTTSPPTDVNGIDTIERIESPATLETTSQNFVGGEVATPSFTESAAIVSSACASTRTIGI